MSQEESLIIENRIKDLRKIHELTQEALASAVGISRQSIISLESGQCIPSMPVARAISRFFNSPMEKVFIFKDTNNREDKMPSLHISPFRGGDFHESLDKFMEDTFPFRPAFNVPQINIYQTDQEIVVEADVPGMKEEDLDIEISDTVLTIRGERKESAEQKTKQYFHREVALGVFQRAIDLPVEVEPEKSHAEIKNGQLIITLPKLDQPKSTAHKIGIKK